MRFTLSEIMLWRNLPPPPMPPARVFFHLVFAVVLAPLSPGSDLRVLSYNIHHGEGLDGKLGLERIAKVIEEAEPDVVALQEVDQQCRRSDSVAQVAWFAERLGMRGYFGKFMDHGGGEYGLAVLSKLPVNTTFVHPLPPGGEPRVALEVVVASGSGDVSVVGLHLDWIDDDTVRFAQAKALAAALDDREHPVVLAGDFNDLPDSRTLAHFRANGFFNIAKSGETSDTFPADAPDREIDFVMVRGAAPGTARVVDERVASDHRPLVATATIGKPLKDLPYKSRGDLSDYENERCQLDLYLPAGSASPTPALLWFHGGGLKNNSKDNDFAPEISQALADRGIAVATVSYRLSPEATFPAYIEDGAAAFAWVHAHAADYGIDPERLFIAGHSAGGYLTSMLGSDPRWLGQHGLTTDTIAGLVPVSGQAMTHTTVREERGLSGRSQVTADEAAPIFHTSKTSPPWLIIYAENDMATRAEENAFFVSALRATGHPNVRAHQIPDRNHGSVAHQIREPGDPVLELIVKFVEEMSRAR